jgi:hypothetical protein
MATNKQIMKRNYQDALDEVEIFEIQMGLKQIWCPYEVNHFQRGICNLCGEVKSKHLTFKEFKKKRDEIWSIKG